MLGFNPSPYNHNSLNFGQNSQYSERRLDKAKDTLELMKLEPPYTDEECEQIIQTYDRVMSGKPQFRDIEDVEARFSEYGSTGSENLILAYEDTVEQIRKNRKEKQ